MNLGEFKTHLHTKWRIEVALEQWAAERHGPGKYHITGFSMYMPDDQPPFVTFGAEKFDEFDGSTLYPNTEDLQEFLDRVSKVSVEKARQHYEDSMALELDWY